MAFPNTPCSPNFQELRSFRLPSVRLRRESIRLRTVRQFSYVLDSELW